MEERTEINTTTENELVADDNINVAENQEEENLETIESQDFEEGGEVEQNTSSKLNWGSVLTFF